jgi:uncharacterized protein YbaP (TraB family)
MLSCKNCLQLLQILQLAARVAVVSSLLLSTTITAHAASVWKVSSDQHSVYIGGTIHILAPEDYPLPTEYAQAFAAANKLVFETDMAAVNSVEFQHKMMAKMTYSPGTTIDQVLDAKTYTALHQHLTLRQIPIAAVANMKANLLAITLSVIELQRMGFTSIGVDQYYANLAVEKGKPQAWLESPDEQIAFLANMGNGDENAMIEYSLRDIENMPDSMAQLRSTWLAGDMPAMAAVAIVPFKAEYPNIYQDLLVTRNNKWLPQIESMLKDDTVELILVGTLHLAGPDSLLQTLAARGYKVEKL